MAILFFHSSCLILLSHTRAESFQFLHILTSTYFFFIDSRHLIECEVRWGLIVVLTHITLMTSDWSIFSCAIGHLGILYGKGVYSSPLPYLKLDCFFMVELWEFFTYSNINPLSNIWFTNTLSPMSELSFHSVDWVLWCTEIFNFDGVQSTCLCFVALILVVYLTEEIFQGDL